MAQSRGTRTVKIAGIVVCVFALAPVWGEENRVDITVRDDYRYIRSNGIPDHATGRFPNRNNPNAIAPQLYAFRVPAKPSAAKKMTPVGLQAFGVAVNGVPFDPGAAEFWGRDPQSGWQYEAIGPAINLGLDQNNAHVQPTGAYHYHGVPWSLFHNRNTSYGMVLVGYAADGFPIYAIYGHEKPNDARSRLLKVRSSYRLREGMREDAPGGPVGPGGRYDGSFVEDYEFVNGAGDLDGCNGRVGVTPEYPDGIYHYFVTEEFPFVPRFYRGTPDISFERAGPPAGGPPPGGPPAGGLPPGRRPPGGGSPPPGAPGLPPPPPPR